MQQLLQQLLCLLQQLISVFATLCSGSCWPHTLHTTGHSRTPNGPRPSAGSPAFSACYVYLSQLLTTHPTPPLKCDGVLPLSSDFIVPLRNICVTPSEIAGASLSATICVSSYCCMCPHTAVCVLAAVCVASFYYVCPHTAVSSYYCVLMLLYVSSYYYVSSLYMCPPRV